VAKDKGVDADPGAFYYLIDFVRGTLKQELRSCYPRDIVNQVVWAARYEGKKPYLDHASIAQAAASYFLTKS
jgi:hypothetical protein